MTRRVLCVRLDNAGDVLLAGPALRAVAAGCDHLTLLAGPQGIAAGRLLPGVDDVLEWRCPWIDPKPAPVDPGELSGLVDEVRGGRFDAALVFTSFHQSALPTALLLRWAGIGWVGAISDDYPGALLDLRHRVSGDPPEAERALSLAEAAGYRLPPGDDGRLAVRAPARRDVDGLLGGLPSGSYVVVHPGTSVPARAWPAERHAETVQRLRSQGWSVVVTGAPGERSLTAAVAGSGALDLGGRTSLAELAAVIAGAAAVVVGNTGPAHLAAAVGTPVVSLFAPTVPAARWAPFRVPCVLLGDQSAACRDTRATSCPVPGHPCLGSVPAEAAVTAVRDLVGLAPGRRTHHAAPDAAPSDSPTPDELEVTR